MSIGYSISIRNSRLSLINDAVNAGVGAGLLRVYDGTRPPTGGTPTTLLAELELSDPAFQTPSSGVMDASAISPDNSADAAGVATWFRVVASDGTFVMDGDVGSAGSGAELEFNSTTFGVGQKIEVNSFRITEGNP